MHDGDVRIAHLPSPSRSLAAAIIAGRDVDRFRAVLQHVEGLGLHQDLLGLLDVVVGAQPLAGAQADDAAEHLGDALQEEQDAGGDDDRLELEDRDSRRAVGADFR